MKRNIALGLVGLSLIWVPAAFSMEALIERQKEDKTLPIVFLHGLSQKGSDMNNSVELLQQMVPGTKIFTPDLEDQGFLPCDIVTRHAANTLNAIPELKDGFNLIGYSLGGLIARSVVESGLLKSRVYSLETLGSPHRGVCGIIYAWDDKIDEAFQKLCKCNPFARLEKKVYKVAYNQDLQNSSCAANLWDDPSKQEEYRKNNLFLPLLNNETPHKNEACFKHNLTTLSVLLALAAKKDTTLEPWQSGMFDYVTKDFKTYEHLKETDMYVDLGLKELDDHNRLLRIPLKGQDHSTIRIDKKVYIEHIVPNLIRRSKVEDDTGKDFYEELQ